VCDLTYLSAAIGSVEVLGYVGAEMRRVDLTSGLPDANVTDSS
jgi:hypothetical protein